MKKLISLTLAAAMTMSLLAGCGSNGSAGTDSADASAETFKIGGIGPITGAGAVYGIAVKNGAELQSRRSTRQVVSTDTRLSTISRMMNWTMRNQ